jgi:hypothetical protein
MIRCNLCGRFVTNATFMMNCLDGINYTTVTGDCKHCHARVPVVVDCYEDLAGYPEDD